MNLVLGAMDCLICTLCVFRVRLAFTLVAEWIRGLSHEVLVGLKCLFQGSRSRNTGIGRQIWGEELVLGVIPARR
jgi:hypothetical protein